MSSKPTPVTPVLSATLEKSTKAIAAAEQSLNKATTEIQSGITGLTNQLGALAQDVELKARELQEVSAAVVVAEREAKIDLDLRVRENEDKVRNDLLKKAGLIATTQAELTELEEAAALSEARANQTERAEVAQAIAAAKAQAANEMLAVQAEHKVTIAQLKANAERDAAMIASLNGQVIVLQDTIAENRKAETARTEAMAKSTINVTNAK